MRKLFIVMAVVVVAAGVSATLLDLNPPDWRGDEGSTMQGWGFGQDVQKPAPDVVDNPYGDPDLTVYPAHPWEREWGGKLGVWPLSGLITIEIPNYPVENPYKLIQIQLTWAGEYDSAAAVPNISVEALLATGAPVPAEDIVLLERSDIDLGPTGEYDIFQNPLGNWYHTTFIFRIEPNPFIETIDIAGSIMVDELIIDTICVPEPATICMLGLGVLLVSGKRRA